MTNRLAIILAGLILIALLADQLAGTGAALALARRFIDLLEWLAFWR